MANVTFDGTNKLITVNSLVTALSVKVDLYAAWKDWVLLDNNAQYLAAFSVIGGEEISTEVTVDTTYFLLNGWKIRPYEGNHVLTITGNLFVDGGGSPMIQTVGNYNVLVNMITSNIINVVSANANVTEQDKTDIATAVHEELQTEFDYTNAFLRNILGLVQHNFRFTDQTYDANGKLLTGTVKLYDTAADCNSQTGHFAEYAISATYATNGTLTDYKIVKV